MELKISREEAPSNHGTLHHSLANLVVVHRALAGAIVVAVLAHRIIFAAARRVTQPDSTSLFASIVRYGANPAQLILILGVIEAVLPISPLPGKVTLAVSRGVRLGFYRTIRGGGAAPRHCLARGTTDRAYQKRTQYRVNIPVSPVTSPT